MRKKILLVGVILLFAFFVTALIYEIPQTIDKIYNSTFSNWNGGGLSYNGEVYQMASLGKLNIQANLGDKVVINDMSTGAPINSVAVFIGNLLNYSTPILTYGTTRSFSYSGTVGTPSLPYAGLSEEASYYTINLGVLEIPADNGLVTNAYNGAYQIKVDVYSTGLNQNYLTIAIILLIAGLIHNSWISLKTKNV